MRLARRTVSIRNLDPLVSFTFDDFPRSALVQGGAILESYGVNGTFFASLGLVGRMGPAGEMFSWDDICELLEHNHELGSHTYDHSHAWETAPRDFEDSIIRNQEALERHVPGVVFTSFSYPSSCPRPETKQRISKYFDCCRGGGQTFNAGSVDLNFVRSCFLEQMRDDFDSIAAMIEANRRAGGWLVFTTHDISEKPSRFGCTPRFFKEVVRRTIVSGASILTVRQALSRIRDASSSYVSAPRGASGGKQHHVGSTG